MPTTFRAAHNANSQEIIRLTGLLRNLRTIRNVTNNWNGENWSEFNANNINRLQNLYEARKRNPAAYNVSKLQKNLETLKNKKVSRLVMYGYVPKPKGNWVYKGTMFVPPSLPQQEGLGFWRVGRPGLKAGAKHLPAQFNTSRWRNAFTAEGILKAPSGKKPVSFKPKPNVHGFIPTLKELAWATKTSNENFETAKTMNNKQLKLFSRYAPVNWTLLKPKRRANPLPHNNTVAYRRAAAARVIQNAVKKHSRAKTSRQANRGLLLRTNSQRARNAQRLQRAPGPANNTRVTWSRRANGTINRHKTLEQLSLNLSKTERNALNKMSENNAVAYIRNLARTH
jgi:hypothetical protein